MKNVTKKILTITTIMAMVLTLAMPMTAEAATIKLNKKTVSVNVKKTYQLKITGTKKKVTWSSSKKSVATVSKKGKVTAKKKGTATITAKVSGKKYTCKVTVKQPVTKVTLNKTTATLSKKGATVTLKATATPSTANNKKVTWKSSNTKVAKVNSNGKVTAVANGTATITATAADGSKKKATCKVTVKNVSAASNANTDTTCQHDWKEVYVEKVVGSVAKCACGRKFDTIEEYEVHAMEAKLNGDTQSHSCTPVDVKESVFDHWECTKCGATKK